MQERTSPNMSTAVEVKHMAGLFLLVVLLFYVWMDVALYYKLQSNSDSLLVVQEYREHPPGLNHTTTQKPNDNNHKSQLPLVFDPFNPISVKVMLVDHNNHYLYYPMGSWLDTDILHISDKMPFITPDMISWSHVCVAAVAGRLLSSELLTHRRLGVILFEVRSFLDSLDGLVARSRIRTRAMFQDHTTWGYWMDGLCDLIGTVFFMLGVLVICKRLNPRKMVDFSVRKSIYAWLPVSLRKSGPVIGTTESDQEPFLPTSLNSSPSRSTNCTRTVSFKQSTVIVFCLSSMMFLSSCSWNRYMEQYHNLLEVPMTTKTGTAENFQVETLRSASFWIIAWSWRLINPHAMMSVISISIFFDKPLEVFTSIQYLGFLPLFGHIITSEVHLQSTIWRLWYLSH